MPSGELLLRAQALTSQGFAPYGDVLDAHGRFGRPINRGTTQRFDLPHPHVHAESGQASLALFRAQAQPVHGPWREMERHCLGSQSFIPLAGARSVVIVALGAMAPQPDSLAAFYVTGDQGFTLHPGTWHHPLIALDAGDFMILERGSLTVDCETVFLPVSVRLTMPDMPD
ncbi:MAG: ureidoglycolate lyase [Pseudomonadota bacterium]|nr:ureidoglycolate lyase [Pseudomonadota bacterium]